MRPTSVTLSSTGQSAWIPVDYKNSSFNLGLQAVISGGASLVWSVQMTSDDIYDPTVTPTAITAPSPMDTGTGNEVGVLTIPCRAVRLSATITTGSVTLTIIQGNY